MIDIFVLEINFLKLIKMETLLIKMRIAESLFFAVFFQHPVDGCHTKI